jgi:hypothetical protein
MRSNAQHDSVSWKWCVIILLMLLSLLDLRSTGLVSSHNNAGHIHVCGFCKYLMCCTDIWCKGNGGSLWMLVSWLLDSDKMAAIEAKP